MQNIELTNENYEKMIDLIPQFLCISDMKGYFKYVNATFESILGYSTFEMMHFTINDIVHPEDESLSNILSDLSKFKSNQISKAECRCKCKDETYRHISWNIRIEWEEGLIYSTGHDITEIKKVETELVATASKLREAQQFANLGYWEYNAMTGYFPWSDEVFRLFGYEAQEFIPTMENFLTIVHPDDRQVMIDIFNGPLDITEFGFDLKIVRPDGNTIYTHQKVSCELDEARKLIWAHGTIQDITERKLDESKLRESEEKYRSLTNNLPVGIIVYDKNGNITYVNPKVQHILGSPSEVETLKINLFTDPYCVQQGASHAYKQCIENGNALILEEQYNTAWGKNITLRIHITPIKDLNNNVMSAIAILDDFTEKKILEAELIKAKEHAEESNKAKGQFLANMSHELRTPMNGIMGMTDLLLLTGLTEEQMEMAQIVKQSSKLLLRIINDILDLSKIDADKIELNPERINIKELSTTLYNIFAVLAKEKGLEFDINVSANIPREIIVDRTRFAQIATNLIGNAIKFTEKGKVTVSFSKVKSIGDKLQLMFSVSDTGIGIREEDTPKLFNYFTQLEDFLTKKFQGTGLGLAISKKLVELMGGEISVESEYGNGSTFYFTFLVDIPKSEQNTADNEHHLITKEAGIKITILLIEDDYVSQLVIKQICKLKNWKLQVASNGRDALALVNNNNYDLILLDVQMPEISGFDIAKNIRENEQLYGGHIPIVATTAYAGSNDRAKCLNIGMDDFISKPMDISKLCTIIEEWTKK